MSAAALLALIVIPLAAAVILLAVPSRLNNVVRTIAVITALAMFGISVYVFVAYNISDGGIQGDMRWDWLSNVAFLGNNGITLHLGVDGIAVPLVLLNGIVGLAGTWVSFKIEYRNKDFFILLFTLIAGVYGTFVSLDLFFFFF